MRKRLKGMTPRKAALRQFPSKAFALSVKNDPQAYVNEFCRLNNLVRPVVKMGSAS